MNKLNFSGIGPERHLKKLKIPVIKNLPVGRNLYDKVVYIGLAFETNCTNVPKDMKDIINKESIKSYLEDGDGPLTKPYSFEAIGNIAFNCPTPNVEYRLRNAYLSTDKGEVDMKTFGISPHFYKKHFRPLEGKRVFSIYVVLKALSSGWVKLKSCNPCDDPLVYGNYFSDPKDRKNMIDAIKFILNFVKCSTFKKYNIQFYDKKIPGCQHKNGDAYWDCAISHLAAPLQDFKGTCKMGDPNDPTAVVDQQGRVIGVKKLWVTGKSVSPAPTFGGANALATLLAERTADQIKQEEGLVLPKFCP